MNMWKLNSTLLNNSKKKLNRNKKILKQMWKLKHNTPKSMECCKSSTRREVHTKISIPQETWETSNKQLNLAPKATRKKKDKKSQS